MKRIIISAIVILIFTLIQSSPVYDGIRNFLTVKPDLVLIFLIFVSFRGGSFEGMLYGFFAGILQDIITIGPIGMNSLIYLNVGFLVGQFKNKIYTDSILPLVILVFFATIFKSILGFFINTFFSTLSGSVVHFKNQILFETLANTMLSPMLSILFDRSMRQIFENKDRMIV